MTPGRIRVLIADDHELVRTGVVGMLATAPDIEIVGQCANGRDALTVLGELTVDVLVTDLRMPEIDGADTIREAARMYPHLGMLVLTTYDDDADILRAMEAGAHGYALKDSSPRDLANAIRATARKETWLTPTVASTVVRQLRTDRTEHLSTREREVLQLVARGYANKEIANHLHVSQATIKTHLIHVFRKLDVSDRTAAVTTALEKGIISIER